MTEKSYTCKILSSSNLMIILSSPLSLIQWLTYIFSILISAVFNVCLSYICYYYVLQILQIGLCKISILCFLYCVVFFISLCVRLLQSRYHIAIQTWSNNELLTNMDSSLRIFLTLLFLLMPLIILWHSEGCVFITL